MLSRRVFLSALALGASGLVAAGPASAQAFLGSYVARMGHQDHFASDGYRLDTAAQVVRQDRANFHRFGRADREDEYDPWFGSADARARLERLLNRSDAMDRNTRNAILNGQPLIRVDVWSTRVRVSILSR